MPEITSQYIQGQINKIKCSVEDKQSRLAWQTVNEVTQKKSTSRGKLQAASQKESLQNWKKKFNNLQRNPAKFVDKLVQSAGAVEYTNCISA